MAEAMVFVDDAVLGRLPALCAKDGGPARNTVHLTEEIGQSNRLGVLWLLILVGPLGWLVILFLLGRDRGEHLTVTIPYGDDAYDRLVAARQLRGRSLVAGIAGVAALALLTFWADLGAAGVLLIGAAGIVAVVGAGVGEFRSGRASVAFTLDASRRWVTLRGVHPEFARACREVNQRADRI